MCSCILGGGECDVHFIVGVLSIVGTHIKIHYGEKLNVGSPRRKQLQLSIGPGTPCQFLETLESLEDPAFKTSLVFSLQLAAKVLEYMTAELVEAAGLQVKKSKAKNKTKQGVPMISPSHIVQAVSWLFIILLIKNIVELLNFLRWARMRLCRWFLRTW